MLDQVQAVHSAHHRPRGWPHDGARRPSSGPKPRVGPYEGMLLPHGARMHVHVIAYRCMSSSPLAWERARAAEHSPHAVRERRGACMQGLTTRHLVALCGGFAHEAWCVSSRGDASTRAVQFNNAIFQYVQFAIKIQARRTFPLNVVPPIIIGVVNPSSLLPCVPSQITVKAFHLPPSHLTQAIGGRGHVRDGGAGTCELCAAGERDEDGGAARGGDRERSPGGKPSGRSAAAGKKRRGVCESPPPSGCVLVTATKSGIGVG
jgi:hypothetical protein